MWLRYAPALLRPVHGFVLHRGVPEQAHVERIGEYWIELIVSQQAVGATTRSYGRCLLANR